MPDSTGLGADITIAAADGSSSKRYPLYRDPKTDLLAFRRLGSVDLHGADPRIPVSEEWNFGVESGGAGMMRRQSPRDPRHYYTTGVDTSSASGARLAGRRVTLTPTRVPVDKPGYFFEDTPGGNAKFDVGTFTAPGSTQSQTVSHNLGVAPKAIIFWGVHGVSDGSIDSTLSFFFGWTDGTNDGSVNVLSANLVTTSTTRRFYSNTLCVQGVMATDTTINDEATLSAWTSSDFTLDWTYNSGSAGSIIHYIAIGGADVSASVDEITLPASTDSTWSTTGVGFKPDTVLFASSNRTVTGGAAGGSLSLGAMDNQGNQWAIYIESLDAQSTSNAKTRQITDGCLITTDGALDAEASYVSMDDDGFTLNYSNAGTQALVSALSIKGLQIKAGTVDKRTSTGNQAAEDPGFTSEAFMVVGGNATTLDALTDGAALAIGAASSTSAVETAAIFDEDAQGTTDTERISDTTAAMILQTTDADGGIDNEATCGNIDMGTAGWLNWGTADANANKLHYLAFAGLAGSNTKMIHYHNGQGLTKISVSSNVPTEEESHDWGAAAVAGPPVKFEDNWYCPLGTEANAQKITTIGDSGTNNAYTDVTDTGSGTSIKAHAFGFIQDGQIARITRGLNQWVDTSLDGSTWSGGADGSSGTEVGDSTTRVTNLVTSPTGTFIGKEDNLYEMSAALSARKVTSFSTSDKGTDNGAGMVNFEGTDTVIYNHNRGAFLFSGVSRPARILMEAIKGMGFYPTLTHEPFKGRYLESAIAQDWLYTLVAVTESSSTFTYILASRLDREQGRFVTYVYDRLSGVCRGLFVDSENRLWTGHVGGGTILYWQLGKDGSPDSGRDSIGFGAASETRRLYLGEVDFGWPYIRKQVFYSSFITEGSHTNITVAPAFLHDGGSEVTPMSAEVTAAGKTQLKASTLGTNDTCYRTMPVLQFKTASGYTNTGTDPLSVLKYTVQAWLRPEASDFVGGYEAILDTKVPYDGGGIPPDALTVRDELVGYQDDLAKQVMFWGTTYTMFVTDVSDLEVKKVEDEMHWVVRVQMAEFPT